MEDISIQICGIGKSWGKVRALHDIRLEIGKGELFGLIGPDGAGKTTLIRILASLLLPGSGTASVEGYDVVKDYRKIRDITAYMPGRFSLYQDLTVAENLSFFATIFGTTLKENYHLIRDIYVQLEAFSNRPAGKLSGGMKQKLALCCALIHQPQVLLLDEPTTGVDAISRAEFWEMLRRLKTQGITILVSTAYMDEAALCDRIALIQEGSILKTDIPSAIPGDYPRRLYAISAKQMYRLLKDLQQMPAVFTAYLSGQHIHFSLNPDFPEPGLIAMLLEKSGHEGIQIREVVPGIEDSFIALMKGESV
ncbi:MAG TPA: ABC transporter ATP-binding protein [Bacteroidales bacterium]|nr:ABC transporter ATP-binding protein [Bacteroidales bacterium]HSA42229.1 ABC transporter ATP-binding protein [Bacteroidales bacterium]